MVSPLMGAGMVTMTRNSKLTACILIAIGVHAAIFTATDIGLRAANDALRSFGPADLGSVTYTHRYYYGYTSQALSGKIPYRDFVFEYPVLAFPLFLIPRLLTSDFDSYRFAFVVEMFLFELRFTGVVAGAVLRLVRNLVAWRRSLDIPGWFSMRSIERQTFERSNDWFPAFEETHGDRFG